MNANEPVAYVDNVWINRPDLAIAIAVGLKKHFGVKE